VGRNERHPVDRPRLKVRTIALGLAVLVAVAVGVTLIERGARQAPAVPVIPAPAGTASTRAAGSAPIAFADAKPILDVFHDTLPDELKSKTPAELEAAWPGWVSRHDAEIRARLARGDEDSLVNFWRYGTTFTSRPRATDQDMQKLADVRRGSGQGPALAAELLEGRLQDLVAGLASPGANERLQFARQVVLRHGINPDTPEGRDQAHDFLIDVRTRVVGENEQYRRAAETARTSADPQTADGAFATLFRERGLSSDTRINADFSLDAAFEALRSKATFAPGAIKRVAIVGPGLDFTDKAEGYDFYPQQTIQPFAVIDSLLRLGLATPGQLQLTTFDLSPRVNQHLETARQRAAAGVPYVLQLPLDRDLPAHQWLADLVGYWQHMGARIGEDVPPLAAPGAGDTRVRAVRVRPAVVLSVTPRDLDIVLERPTPLLDNARFDVVIATNILVYYGPFEQALALANVAAMLRPGGVFLANSALAPKPPLEPVEIVKTQVFFDRQGNGDTLFGYRKR
jgi:SAM-dependent methyltransferase